MPYVWVPAVEGRQVPNMQLRLKFEAVDEQSCGDLVCGEHSVPVSASS